MEFKRVKPFGPVEPNPARFPAQLITTYNNKFISDILKVLLSALVIVVLVNPGFAMAETIRIGGTGSALGIMCRLAPEFEKKHSDKKVVVLPSLGSSGAIKAISKEALELGVISRPLKRDESSLGLRVSEFAKTPFVIIVGSNVPVSNINHSDLVKILSGEIKTWANGERVRLVLRPPADADSFIIRNISPDMRAAFDKALSRQGMLMALTNQEAVDFVEKTPGALGFATLAQVIYEGHKSRVISYNGVFPDKNSFKDGTYPLSLKFAFVTKPGLSSAVGSFIDFVKSPAGASILKKSGCFPTTGKR